MKIRKRMLSALAVIFLCFLFPGSSKAAPYTYTVRLYPGVQGYFTEENLSSLVTLATQGGAAVTLKDGAAVISGLTAGDRVTFSQNAVTMDAGNKYYARGIRESGKDNSAADSTLSFPVTGDQDYVVAYGLIKDQVAYTIRYVDASGNALHAAETFYGNDGDRIIVAYRYIEGYTPDAYNKALTLKKDGDNTFTFTYHVRTVGENVTVNRTYVNDGTVTGDPIIINNERTAADETAAAETETVGTENAGAKNARTGDAAAGDGGTGAEAGGNELEIPDEETPLELQDLDDEKVPLANFDLGEKLNELGNATFLGKLPLAVKIVIILAAIGTIAVALWFLFFARKKEKESAEDVQEDKPR